MSAVIKPGPYRFKVSHAPEGPEREMPSGLLAIMSNTKTNCARGVVLEVGPMNDVPGWAEHIVPGTVIYYNHADMIDGSHFVPCVPDNIVAWEVDE